LKRRSSLYHPSQAGFTLVELVILIIVLGILVTLVGYKGGCSGCDAPTEIAREVAVDQVVADIQYTQMLAMGSLNARSIVFGWFTNSYEIQNQSGTVIERRRLPSNITSYWASTVTFNSLGEKTGGTTVLSIGGNSITVYGITGKVAS
jgi:hypothetical protein